jgi:signal transduction histidine kinase/ligand-binding sensor domain-containing protein/CheY-like chemotaxis protein
MLKWTWRRMAIAASVCAGMLFVLAGQAIAAVPARGEHRSEPHFIRFGVEQGLSSTINDLAIDRQGYIWVATGDGLARYDGTSFHYWRRVVGDPDSLPDNEVTLIHVDSEDRLWAATWFALSVLDPDHRVPRTIRFRGDAARCGIDITAMTSTPEGVLWLGNYAGDICQIATDGTVLRLSGSMNQRSYLDGAVPVAMKALSSGGLLIGADTGLWWVEPNAPHSHPIPIHKEKTEGGPVFALSSAKHGAIWVGAENGLFLIGANNEIKSLPWQPPKLSRRAIVLHAKDNNYWIGSYYGLYRRKAISGPEIIADSGFGIDSGVNSIVEDSESGIWLGSNSEGLLYIPPENNRFLSFQNFGILTKHNIVGGEIDREGVVLALASDGLYQSISSVKGEYEIELKSKISMENPRSIGTCDEGVYFISNGEGFLIFHIKTSKIDKEIKYDIKNALHRMEAIQCNVKSELWVSFYGGGILVYSQDGKLIREFSPEETLGEEAEAFIDLRFSPDGSPWYSDGKDLRRWDGDRFVRVPLPTGEYVYSLDFASASQLWVARFGSLERYEWDGFVLRLRERVTAQEGLPSVETRSVLVTSTGNIWLNTVRGLVHYDPNQHRARLFGLRDGLPGLDFTVDVLKRRGDGPAIAISKEGIVMFDPDQPLPPPRASALAVETIELRRGEDTVAFSRHGDGELRAVMQPDDRDLRIVARVMSFADPAAYRYKFKLNGYDPDWVDQGDRGERVFSALSPGHYVLEVQGANADGVWSPTRRIEILVQAPWWQRWWAMACYVVALAMLFWWIAYLYRQRLKRRHDYQMIAQKREVAEQASQAKSRFLADLGHEVRTPMTGVLGMSELLLSTSLNADQQGQVRSIRRAGEHLLRLVNDALDLARIEAGRLDLDVVDFDLDTLVEEVAVLMRPLAERKGLVLRVAVAPETCGGWRGDPTRIRQILLNLIGNAVKFTERGEVALSIDSPMTHGLRAIVSDTGPGLDAEQQQRLFRRFEQAEGARTASRYGGSGLGLAICRELALAMGGSIELHSAQGEGARFTVNLPLQRATSTTMYPYPLQSGEDMQSPCNVLLVEDDAIVADVLMGMLQAQGHRVTHVGHALAAMTEIATSRFDIALLDLDLPGMDGLALASHLRGQGCAIPLIAITARADNGAEKDARDAGFDAFLRKPLTGDALGGALREQLAQRSGMD